MPTIDEGFTALANVSTEMQDLVWNSKHFADLVGHVLLHAFAICLNGGRADLVEIRPVRRRDFGDLIAKAAVVLTDEPMVIANFGGSGAVYEQLRRELLALPVLEPTTEEKPRANN